MECGMILPGAGSFVLKSAGARRIFRHFCCFVEVAWAERVATIWLPVGGSTLLPVSRIIPPLPGDRAWIWGCGFRFMNFCFKVVWAERVATRWLPVGRSTLLPVSRILPPSPRDGAKIRGRGGQPAFQVLQVILTVYTVMLASASPGDDASFLNYKKDPSDLFNVCRPSDSTVSEDAGIEPRIIATLAMTARRSDHSARHHQDYHFCLMPNQRPQSQSSRKNYHTKLK